MTGGLEGLMSPITEKARTPDLDEIRASTTFEQSADTTPSIDEEPMPEESLEDKEHNPWRNHEDDQHKWLGMLLAAIGFGAIGYLIGGV